MNTQLPFVSVVTPFYNTEAYLAECIESVIDQTHQNLEYILLDNCSTDRSLEIAKDYARRDSRIRVVEAREFVGQVENYNRALREICAHSEYTKIVEADNWLYPECLETMCSLAEQNPSVAFVSSYNITEHFVRFRGVRYDQDVYSGAEAARLFFLSSAYMFAAPTTVLFRSAEVRRRVPFFPEDGIFAEDIRVCFDLLRTGGLGFVHQILSFVRTENESILSKVKDFDTMTLVRLTLLKTHGREFLSAREFDACMRDITRRQYRIVAAGLLMRKGNRFLDFHRQGMSRVGEDIRLFRLATEMLLVILAWLANPGYSVAALFRRARCGISSGNGDE